VKEVPLLNSIRPSLGGITIKYIRCAENSTRPYIIPEEGAMEL
jgi:hypothetical protein